MVSENEIWGKYIVLPILSGSSDRVGGVVGEKVWPNMLYYGSS